MLCSLLSLGPLPLPSPPLPITELQDNDDQGATSLADEALGEIAKTGRVQCVLHLVGGGGGGGAGRCALVFPHPAATHGIT